MADSGGERVGSLEVDPEIADGLELGADVVGGFLAPEVVEGILDFAHEDGADGVGVGVVKSGELLKPRGHSAAFGAEGDEVKFGASGAGAVIPPTGELGLRAKRELIGIDSGGEFEAVGPAADTFHVEGMGAGLEEVGVVAGAEEGLNVGLEADEVGVPVGIVEPEEELGNAADFKE
jgi:hypothetical protein